MSTRPHESDAAGSERRAHPTIEELVARIETLEGRLAEERSRAEQLRESEARLRQALRIETVGVIFWGPDVTILETNSAFLRMSGFEAHEVVGRSWKEFTPEEFHPASEAFIAQLEATGEATPYEKQYIRKDGSRWWGLFAARRIGPDEVVEFVLDVTRRKETEHALDEARALAEKASRAKSQFLSTMSHELRTPLSAVVGFADLMETGVGGPLTETQADFLARIKSAVEHETAIIDDILTFSRSVAGTEEAHPVATDVARIARAVVRMLEGHASARGLRIRLAGADDLVPTVTDPGKVRRILTNLVDNALKYTDQGAVDVELAADEDRIELRVADSGPGIPADRIDEIFEPFTQLDQSTTRVRGGTGLGLTLCRRLAALVDGRVSVESDPGSGSTFTLHLPRHPVDDDPELTAAP